ncbi:MAG: putative toxin-antitoxin system toxin component, PIN family [Clostridiales bacterium]|jgi:putative PIN family toxin of toxin-antitoxin system|nr:putative toxin-antitoxin system toxin component, PIN family [Clostridiales bacterium]
MKVVIDVNVFISSFFWKGKPREVLNRSVECIDKLFVTNEILEEIIEVMSRPKFYVDKEAIEYYIRSIEEISNKIIVSKKIQNVSRDKDDNAILECAIEGKVDYIITGDEDLLVLI